MGLIEDKENLLRLIITEFKSVHSYTPMYGQFENLHEMAFKQEGGWNLDNYPGLIHILDKNNSKITMSKQPQRYVSGDKQYLIVNLKEFVKEKPPPKPIEYIKTVPYNTEPVYYFSGLGNTSTTSATGWR